MTDVHKYPCHDTGQSIVSVDATKNNSVLLDCIGGNNGDITDGREHIGKVLISPSLHLKAPASFGGETIILLCRPMLSRKYVSDFSF